MQLLHNSVTFDIDNLNISFHVKDTDAAGARAKTADQRSDGFKQFISFLLTISAQNKGEQLHNSILLLDEPETHLHPQAQQHLMAELVKITQNSRNNIVLFATHSNYMIDKDNLSRNYRVEKANEETKLHKFNGVRSTYASVNYEVFEIITTDYFNEIYAELHIRFQNADQSDDTRDRITEFDKKYLNGEKQLPFVKPNTKKNIPNNVTLPTYIRNCIHHPDNKFAYSREELSEAIQILRSYL